MAFTYKIPMTTEAANLKLRRVSSSKQNFPGVGRVRVTFASKRIHLEEEGQKYCRHPIGSVTQWQRLFYVLCQYCSDCIERFFLQVFKFSFQISRFIDLFE